MPTTLSHRHIVLIINGHRYEGYASDDSPVEFGDNELVNTERGKDGTLYGTDTSEIGTVLTVKLLPVSRSAIRVLQWYTDIQRGQRLEFEGSYGDNELNYSCQMRGGFLTQCPSMIVPGKTFEHMFEFEEVIPDVDGARFAPAPLSVV